MAHVRITHYPQHSWHVTLGDPKAHQDDQKHFQVASDASGERGAKDTDDFKAALLKQSDPELKALASADWGAAKSDGLVFHYEFESGKE